MARPAARATQCRNNLKQIGLALYQYQSTWGSFPPAFTVDAYGNRLHSWRTLILPYLEEQSLYSRIDLSKPWDDPANAELANARVHAFACPSISIPQTHTNYMAIVDPRGVFYSDASESATEGNGVKSQSIFVVEVDAQRAIPWMSPQDADPALVLSFSADKEFHHQNGRHVLMENGHVRTLDIKLKSR